MSQDEINDIKTSLSRTASYDPSVVVLIGTHMPPTDKELTTAVQKCREGEMKVHSDLVEKLTLSCGPEPGGRNATHAIDDKERDEARDALKTTPTIAVIYAYAYEGHTYRLPKPRIMVVRGAGSRYDEGEKDGPEGPVTGELYVWRIGKHQMSISIEVETGTVQSLVLDANQPGNRNATSYHSHMQLSHRGGRLT